MERLLGVKLRWVEAHQKVLNTREQKLNDITDKLAKLQHMANGKWNSRARPMILPSQMVQVHLHQDIYNRNYKNQARRHLHGVGAE